MSDFKVTGKVEKILPVVKGTSKAGAEWQKLEFVVKFNVKSNEWKDKYFTSLAAWSVFKAEAPPAFEPVTETVETDGLPF